MTCPDCGGAKEVRGYACPGFRPIVMPCFCCGGTGVLTEAQAAAVQEGERLRADRLARGLSLIEEAKRLKISPVVLSERERGRTTATG